MSPYVAAFAGVLAFASAWEVAGLGAPAAMERARRRLRRRAGAVTGGPGAWASRLGAQAKLERAGLAGRVSPRAFVLAKWAGAGLGAASFAVVGPVAPGRLAPPLALALVAAGFLAPDALAERRARGRRARMVASLPDALDLLAVGAAAGRAPAALLGEVAAGSSGALAQELAVTVADIHSGVPQVAALDELRRRTGASELGALSAALERSRRYGSPLADQLHAQAATLRRSERRRTSEQAARAAPKIQLVVALVLVPSALLTIAAALVAHSDKLLGAI